MADISKITTLDGTTYDLKDAYARQQIPTKVSDLTNDSGFIAAPSANADEVIAYNGTTWVADKRMVILSYGSSTWTDFINAYNSNAVVYCRASSNSNPASGAQTRMAFMAYVNNANPTNVEFQYYRSVSSHSVSQQGDQVFIYKLDKTAGWSVITRNSFTKIAVGTGLSSSYASQTLTITNTEVGLPSVTATDNGKVLRVVDAAWAVVSLPSASGVSF